VLNSDTTGQFYYLSLIQSFFDDMWRSVNGGQDWQNIGPATGGDKQWFTIDNSNSPGHGFQYQVWSTAGNNYTVGSSADRLMGAQPGKIQSVFLNRRSGAHSMW